ncbi:hypothetical protein GCM10028778_24230 [Barrientosiimonas marina]|uniref:Uncharacterized protein n=1 Tax=Lentibacillus kimchii TaxID=1542911 RepID=A0ABW2UY68_9BACI
MTAAEAQHYEKTKIFLFVLICNIAIDGIVASYLKTIPYATIILTLLCFTIIGAVRFNTKKFNRLRTGLIIILVVAFLYVLGLNHLTPLSVPYWALFYPAIVGITTYIDIKYKPEGLKKFFIHFAGFVLFIAGVALYSIQFPPA